MNVAINSSPFQGNDKTRGIGMHTSLLVDHLRVIPDLHVDVVDFITQDLSLYDVVHYPSFHPHFLTLPRKKITKTVVTIHDLIRLLYPSAYPAGVKGNIRFLLQKYFLKNVDAFITISETSKKDIIRFLGIPSQKIHITYLASNPLYRPISSKSVLQGIQKKYKLPKSFVLYVGDVNYNKNIPVLAQACTQLDVDLVIIGKQANEMSVDFSHIENNSLKIFIEQFSSHPKIHRLGFVPYEDMSAIYSLASVYCQPSLYEGFGLPLLEAFACHCPVIASRIQVFNEIAEGAFYPFSPSSVSDLIDALSTVLHHSSLRKSLVEKGTHVSKRYTWEKTAESTYAVYKSL
jgi:glycosyltransferase involved in cell wall biosynthesis